MSARPSDRLDRPVLAAALQAAGAILTALSLSLLLPAGTDAPAAIRGEIWAPALLNLVVLTGGWLVLASGIRRGWKPAAIFGWMMGEFLLKVLALIGLLTLGISLLDWSPVAAALSFAATFLVAYALRMVFLIRLARRLPGTVERRDR